MGFSASYDTGIYKIVPKDAVVLDLGWAESIPVLVAQLRGGGYIKIADQIEAQTKPPRIPEPGEGGVVEASCVHGTTRFKWVRAGLNWHPVGAPRFSPDDWDSLIDPVLIREGVA